MNTQQIYIACLSSYNNSILHGEWIECNEGLEHIQAEVNKIMKSSPMDDAEEWAIHDFSGFNGIEVNEYDSLEHIAVLAEALENLDDNELTVFEYILSMYSNVTEAKEKMDEVNIFNGSRGDYAQEITEECSEVPEYLANYIDYDAMGRDFEFNGDLVELDHNLYITNANEL